MIPDGLQTDVITSFLTPYFGFNFSPRPFTTTEHQIVAEILDFVQLKFSGSKYVLGLALDFTLLAQKLSKYDAEARDFRPHLRIPDLFARYTLLTSRGTRQANTLTLEFQGQREGIRRIEESVVDLFISLFRPGYPSAYVYNTGQWHKFQDTLLIRCFQLSEHARDTLCRKLIQFGIETLKPSVPLGRAERRVRLYEEILRDYPRSGESENGGAVFQGIAAGFLKADRPHLYLIVDKTRTGSARQARIGDLDGYFGLDLEVSAEAKDFALTEQNCDREIGEFLAKLKFNRISGLVFCISATPTVVETIRAANAVTITLGLLLTIVESWDWRKQDAAVNGLLHYLAHVEQNPVAVDRLITFIQTKDPSHESVIFYKETAVSS